MHARSKVIIHTVINCRKNSKIITIEIQKALRTRNNVPQPCLQTCIFCIHVHWLQIEWWRERKKSTILNKRARRRWGREERGTKDSFTKAPSTRQLNDMQMTRGGDGSSNDQCHTVRHQNTELLMDVPPRPTKPQLGSPSQPPLDICSNNKRKCRMRTKSERRGGCRGTGDDDWQLMQLFTSNVEGSITQCPSPQLHLLLAHTRYKSVSLSLSLTHTHIT